jgi:lipoate-protein ligase A
MTRFPECRLVIDAEPNSGAWNMAVDEALLESAAAGGLPTVRWYGWRRPTVSLGYFQPAEAAAPWREAEGVDVVRRLTGGGAIVHHREWTYSVTLPALAPLLGHPYELYGVVHAALCRSFEQQLGLRLDLRGVTRRDGTAPALCYLREDEHDVCYRGTKIIGSAQRRRRGALLQHGSALLAESPHAPGIRGLADLAPALAERLHASTGVHLAREIAAGAAANVVEAQLLPHETARAEELSATKYSHLKWTIPKINWP